MSTILAGRRRAAGLLLRALAHRLHPVEVVVRVDAAAVEQALVRRRREGGPGLFGSEVR